ncbi:hypothetical protein V6N13_062359 [Hibiscus sabdariffa]
MDVPGLTGSKVASHLQKYRMYLRWPGNLNNSFMYQQTSGPVSSVDVFDLQELASSDQAPTEITIEHLLRQSPMVDSRPI